MSKPWTNTGLSDFRSWLGLTHVRDGLIYRGDTDFEQLGPKGQITVMEFKNAGEPLGRGQLNWLRVRARQDKTEVRVVRERVGTDPTDPKRSVSVWNPGSTAPEQIMPLPELAEWLSSRAYRSGKERPENLPYPAVWD